ncbi:conserved hypothetical protein [Catenulispora acidiphila DSM 44928]|uniref:VWFA domain-containing protein n=1 Tax=Catenulispora acidiphila (strain DSM 44928 / JCM 14897 / NBRC 102108 / NRRL B-24433 / ID139908) TaxID=479433 RepID=C7Q5B1_CATAD|nr:hypothetical protein [Catenulispora acidiphila]ACU75880.1 conserved hypothetical protein [Catenulispora acidiphila DSM 44928]
MGSGRWDYNAYEAAEAYRKASGRSAFDYNDRVLSRTPRNQWRAHPDLEPYGVGVRESRDSAEHPTSLAISVLFDVTGSMGGVPRVLQTKLGDLHGLLLRKGYVDHPQIMFGAIGDAYSDRVPLQVGQFESDNRMDDQLGDIVLEGGGGGQMRESYELAMYFMAHHTALDCHDKRGKRGYLFIIGDEMPYPNVNPQQVSRLLGPSAGRGGQAGRAERPGRGGRGGSATVPIEDVVRDLTRKFDVYYILPEGSSYVGNDEVLGAWRALLGQNVIQLDDLDAVCETIALTIGLAEDRIDLDGGLEDLRDVGSRAGGSVERALGGLDTRRSGRRPSRHHTTADPAVRYLRSQGADYSYDSGYDNRPESRW